MTSEKMLGCDGRKKGRVHPYPVGDDRCCQPGYMEDHLGHIEQLTKPIAVALPSGENGEFKLTAIPLLALQRPNVLRLADFELTLSCELVNLRTGLFARSRGLAVRYPTHWFTPSWMRHRLCFRFFGGDEMTVTFNETVHRRIPLDTSMHAVP